MPHALAIQDLQDKWTQQCPVADQNREGEVTTHDPVAAHALAIQDLQDTWTQQHPVADQNGEGEVTTHDPLAAQDSGGAWVPGDLAPDQQDGWDEVEWY